jgi:hypothetical protein
VQAPFNVAPRSYWAAALLPVALLLSSCSENMPVSPTTESPALDQREPDLDLNAGRRVVALRVANKATLRPNGEVAVRVRAFCRRGYQITESGPLSLTQIQGEREAYGEGFLQLQLGGCSGRWEQGTVVVRQFEEPQFRRGPARVSVTFAVVRSDDPEGEPVQVVVVKQLRIR